MSARRLLGAFVIIALALSVAPPIGAASKTVKGIASYVNPSYGSRYLALPEHKWGRPGFRVMICGPADCVNRTSTDAGPDLPMQRAGRIADMSFRDFATVCGCNPKLKGTVKVTVYYLGKEPFKKLIPSKALPTPPPTDVERYPRDIHYTTVGSQPAVDRFDSYARAFSRGKLVPS